jgi:hypothetical protein
MADGIRRNPIPYITPTIAAARKAQFTPFILSSVAITPHLQFAHRRNGRLTCLPSVFAAIPIEELARLTWPKLVNQTSHR